MPSSRKNFVEFDPDSLSFGEDPNEDNVGLRISEDEAPEAEFTYNEIKDAHWFYDTPGIMKERDVSTTTHRVGRFCVGTKTLHVCYSITRFSAC